MYDTTTNYQNTIYESSTRHLIKILINDIEINKKYILDVKPTIKLFSNDTLAFGSTPSQGFEIKLYKDAIPDIINKIYIVSGIEEEEIPFGYLNLDEISKVDDYTVLLKVYDNMIKFETNYDGSKLIYPCTLMTLLKDICSKKGVELGSTSFLNMDERIAVYDNSISARTYLSYISEQAGGFACIGRDGKLYIKKIGESIIKLPLKYFQSYTWGESFKITRIRYEDGIQVFEKGNSSGNTIYINQDNMFIVNQQQIDNIYENYKDLEIYSFEGNSIIDPAIDIGDLLEIDGRYVIYQGTLEYTGKWKASIESKINGKAKQETTVRTPSQKAINRKVQSQIDQENLKIEQLVQESSEYAEKLVTHEQDINGLKQQVQSSATYKRTVEGVTEVYLTDAGEADILQFEIRGNKRYETSLFPDDDLYPMDELYPNIEGSELL